MGFRACDPSLSSPLPGDPASWMAAVPADAVFLRCFLLLQCCWKFDKPQQVTLQTYRKDETKSKVFCRQTPASAAITATQLCPQGQICYNAQEPTFGTSLRTFEKHIRIESSCISTSYSAIQIRRGRGLTSQWKSWDVGGAVSWGRVILGRVAKLFQSVWIV